MLFIGLLVLQIPAEIASWNGLPIPKIADKDVNRYSNCLYAPLKKLASSGRPKETSSRNALFAKALTDCSVVRTEVSRKIDTKLAAEAGWTDPLVRSAKITRMLDAYEDRVEFTIVRREEFDKLIQDYSRCVNAEQKDCKTRFPPPVLDLERN